MKKIGILYHPIKKDAVALAKELEDFLTSKGLSTWKCSAWEEDKARTMANGTDLILTTGGDGTILHAVQVAASTQTPITGINLGKLGFMTEMRADEAKDKLSSLLEGKGWLDERSMIEAEVSQKGTARQSYYALNDVVAARGAIARMINVEASIDGEPLTTYKADGVIVATATGSTGYSLAAGGPILHPQASEFVLLPISPHLSSAYSLVLPAAAVVKLRVATFHQATLSIDGIINLPLTDGATVTVKHSAQTVRFLRIYPRDFYAHLEQKLKGKQ